MEIRRWQFKVNSPGIFVGPSGFPGVSSGLGYFSGCVSVITPHNENFKLSFYPAFCAGSLTEGGNGLATPRLFTDSAFLLSRLLCVRHGPRCWAAAEKKTGKSLSLRGVDILAGETDARHINTSKYLI